MQKQVGFKGNQHTSANGQNVQKQATAEELAARHKVGAHTMRRDAAYATAIDDAAKNQKDNFYPFDSAEPPRARETGGCS